MENLFTAIFNKWVAATNYGLTELYNTEADSEAVFPYATMTVVGDEPDWTFAEDSENFSIQFDLFSEDPECTELSTAFALLDAAFHKQNLTIASAVLISMVREGMILRRVEGRWHIRTTYLITFEKN